MSEIDLEQNGSSFSDLMYKWKFKEDDWLVNIVLGNPNIRFRIFRLKSYNSQEINNIIYDIYKDVKKHRMKLELNSKEFIEKKKYLTDPSNSDKIQISLEDEYTLKYLIEMYKLYELISWFHIGKNDKIIKHCSIEKQKLIDKMYPIVGVTIEKVIGSKVIKPTLFRDVSSKPNFDDAVNNAWFNIVKYLPKIDTSKPMFSIFVGTAQGSAKNFKLDSYKKEMNQINMSALERNDENMDEDTFYNKVLYNNDSYNEAFDVESDIIDSIDNEIDYSQFDINAIVDEDSNLEFANIENSIYTTLEQNILSVSYTILSGKVKRLCYKKIFAEFFIELITSKIDENIIRKHTPVLIDIMNAANNDNTKANDTNMNNSVYKLFKDWIKARINTKMRRYNINYKQSNSVQLSEILKDENAILKYLKDNKSEILKELLEYRKLCNTYECL